MYELTGYYSVDDVDDQGTHILLPIENFNPVFVKYYPQAVEG